MPIILTTLTIINGITAIVRVAEQFPVFGFEPHFLVFSIFYTLEDIAYYEMIWLYGLKLY